MDKYELSIEKNKVTTHIGTFESLEEAELACNNLLGSKSVQIIEPVDDKPVYISKHSTEHGSFIMVMRRA